MTLSPFDPHVHLRGMEYPSIAYLRQGIFDAQAVGLCGMMEMPNPSPPITDLLISIPERSNVITMIKKNQLESIWELQTTWIKFMMPYL